MSSKISRCALYTRKSSEEGLEQDFNSLDAQREACAAYVQSQAHEGWRKIDTHYDDGGFSGGSMERPALKRLLADIEAGSIDIIVVYKIDRLTRSLPDFARMVDLFDRHEVSFVSVTQSFNTTSSMGRLTLNVLLSFAQFEREVTGERIRDKIAASKAKGMWMGGNLPLGYDAPKDGSRTLVVNDDEARTVRLIFETYLELGSVHALAHRLAELGIRSKLRQTRKGRMLGGQPFSRGALFHLLRNRVYLGMIVHKEEVHPGGHAAIVDQAVFETAQQKMDTNIRRRGKTRRACARAPLTGRIFDEDGQPMSPTFSYGKQGKLYRYYVSSSLQKGKKRARHDASPARLSASTLEQTLTKTLSRLMGKSVSDPLGLIERVEIYQDELEVVLHAHHLARIRKRLGNGEHAKPDLADPKTFRLTLPICIATRGGRSWLIGNAIEPSPRPDPVLVRALRTAHSMLEKDPGGLPFLDTAPDTPYLRRLLRLAFLSPDLQKQILQGRQPTGLTLSRLLKDDIPPSWQEQRQRLGAFGKM